MVQTLPISTADISKGLSATQQVTNNAQASITLVPNLSSPPTWYLPIHRIIQTIQSHSDIWLNSICPLSSKTIPATIEAFDSCFQKESTDLLNLIEEISHQGGKPTQNQLSQSRNILQSISSSLETQKSSVSRVNNKALDYMTGVLDNQSQLAKLVQTIEKNIENSAGDIIKIQSFITDKFLNSSILGPCNTIVTIDINISIQISEISSDPQLIAYIYTKDFIDKQVTNLSGSKQYIQDVLDLWSQISLKYEAVIKNIDAAKADKILPFLESLDLKNAQSEWAALAKYVHSTLDNS